MEIKQQLCPAAKYYLKCPNVMKPIGITIHNTANDAPAKNEIAYMLRNNDETSFHFAVDDVEIIQGIPLDRNAWHAGDGYGDGNMRTISIEICYSKSGGERFDKAEKNAAWLVAYLLKKYNWSVKNIYRHRDWSKKMCPHRTMEKGWDRFIDMVQKNLQVTGWIKDNIGWWYKNDDGSYPVSDWKFINGSWYYFDDKGYMVHSSWILDNNKWYYLNQDGDMARGWIKYKDKWYYLKQSGEMVTGFVDVGNHTYYLAKDGDMYENGIYNIDNKYYIFNHNGELQKNIKIGDDGVVEFL